MCVLPDIVAQHPQAADQHGHLRRAEVQQLRLVDQQRLGFGLGPGFDEVAKTIGNRLEQTERLDIGLLLRGVGTAWGEGHAEVVASVFRRLLHTRVTRQNDQVGEGNFLAATLRVEVVLDALQLAEHCGQLRRLVGFPVFLRCQAQAATVGAAAFVRTAETCGSGPGGGYQLRHRQA
ncbi:hypothetical protein D3C72_1678900 [compost metagenome]